jgi:hypothetical protein
LLLLALSDNRGANVRFWHDSAVKRWAEHVRSAQVFQTSTCSAIAKAFDLDSG